MAKQIESIDWLMSRLKKLSKNPAKNADEIEKIEEKIINQAQILNNVDVDKMINRMCDPSISKEEYDQYLKVFREIKKYSEYSEEIYMMLNEKNKNKKGNNAKIAGLIIGGSLLLGVGGFVGYKLANNNSNNSTVESTSYSIEKVGENTQRVTEQVTEKITETEATTQKVTEATTEKVTEATTEINTETVEAGTESSITNTNVSEAEQYTVVETFKTMKEDVVELYNSNQVKKVRKVAKQYITNTIDFIFFNASINGITFNNLKQDFKNEIYDYLKTMDGVIMKVDPDYKESLGDKYNAVKDFSKKKIEQAKELIIEKIGQEKYDSIIAKKEEIIEKITSAFKEYGGKALKFLKDKYLEWKED